MNIAEIFVRRPVMTILVMTGILIFGVIAVPAVARQRAAQRRFPHDPGAGAAARREPRHDGLGGRRRLWKSSSRPSPASTR
jgi:hypothetical protein